MDPDAFKDVFAWLWNLTGEPHFHSTIILAGYGWLAARTKKVTARVEQQEVEIMRLRKQVGHLLQVIGMRKHESAELGVYLPLPTQHAGDRPDMRRPKK